MTKDEALQMCLEYIETDAHERKYVRHAIKSALEESKQKWINLTLTEIELLFIENTTPKSTAIDFARAIESRLKEKNETN
jgi:hypothetical protein